MRKNTFVVMSILIVMLILFGTLLIYSYYLTPIQPAQITDSMTHASGGNGRYIDVLFGNFMRYYGNIGTFNPGERIYYKRTVTALQNGHTYDWLIMDVEDPNGNWYRLTEESNGFSFNSGDAVWYDFYIYAYTPGTWRVFIGTYGNKGSGAGDASDMKAGYSVSFTIRSTTTTTTTSTTTTVPFTECEQYGVSIDIINCPNCQLNNGDNYIKYIGTTDDIDSAVSRIINNIDAIWYYDGSSWYVWNPSTDSPDTLNYLINGRCYYIKTSSGTYWTQGTISGNIVINFIKALSTLIFGK